MTIEDRPGAEWGVGDDAFKPDHLPRGYMYQLVLLRPQKGGRVFAMRNLHSACDVWYPYKRKANSEGYTTRAQAAQAENDRS